MVCTSQEACTTMPRRQAFRGIENRIGYGNTKLSNIFFENKLKVTATTRNWKTINELVYIAEKLTGGL
jgi:uncharacterized protein (DUF1697 family)